MNQYKIYSDGNHFPVVKSAGFGGYVADPNGNVLVEFTQQILEKKHICDFELLGIIRGLTLAKDLEAKNVISHCDHKISVKFLNILFGRNHNYTEKELQRYNREFTHSVRGPLYQNIIDLSKSFDCVEFKYIPRDQNKRSDALSRKYVRKLELEYMAKVKDLEKESSDILNSNSTPVKDGKEYIFTYDKYIKVSHKNNPFMSSDLRNKKIRRFCMKQKDDFQAFLYLEYLEKSDHCSLKAKITTQFQEEIKIPIEYTWEKDNNSSRKNKKMFNKYQQYLREVLIYLHNKNLNSIWIYSNIGKPQEIMEQKKPFKHFHLLELRQTAKTLSKFNKILFNRLPVAYLPENKSGKKKKVEYNNEFIDDLVNKIKSEENQLHKKKLFGKLVSIYVRKIKSDLNLVELNTEEVNSIRTDLEQLCSYIENRNIYKR